MKYSVVSSILIFLILESNLSKAGGPPEKDFKGRIAWSADGNWNDEDDWSASPVALAIFAEMGAKANLVHFDYNNILSNNNKDWAKEHETSVLGAAERFGYSKSIFHNCQDDLDAAVNSLSRAIDASSKSDPLYFVLAGPPDVLYMAMRKSDAAKFKYVYCISHNRWNDGYGSTSVKGHNKRDIIQKGISWIQITDQNRFLTTSPFGRPAKEEEWEPWHWMRDSKDANIRFIWDRMRAENRADCSDAGMAYFLMTGDERCEIQKLRNLVEAHCVPHVQEMRRVIRMEAENFVQVRNFEIRVARSKNVSQNLGVEQTGKTGSITTTLDGIWIPTESNYDLDLHYYSGSDPEATYSVSVNNVPVTTSWTNSAPGSWLIESVRGVDLKKGDQIMIEVKSRDKSGIVLDYIELTDWRQTNPFTANITGPLDDPNAMPGQIIVAGKTAEYPGYLKYNGAGPAFLAGPDNPEDFLYMGKLNADGTRSEGKQEETIENMRGGRVNAFHCQMFRMKTYNIKGEWNDKHVPFINFDPSAGLNQAMLDQWEGWLDLFEENGITVEFEFYNDATDVEMHDLWKLDEKGNLHPDEYNFISGVVKKFKHHKNIIWCVEESANKIPRSRVTHYKKVAEAIAETDNFNHPIVQSFVVPEDHEWDFPIGGSTSDDYVGDPNIQIISWLHVPPSGRNYDEQYNKYLKHYLRDSRNFIVFCNETYKHPFSGYDSRVYAWACVMTGTHNLNAYHYANKPRGNTMFEDGLISQFMQKTDFHRMEPRSDLAAGETNWVLARPGHSYILYGYDCESKMGVKQMTEGNYELTWFDPATGETVIQSNVRVGWEDAVWPKPASIGKEVALYIKRI